MKTQRRINRIIILIFIISILCIWTSIFYIKIFPIKMNTEYYIIILILVAIILIPLGTFLFFKLYSNNNLNKNEDDITSNKIIENSKDEIFLLLTSFKSTLDALKQSTISAVDFDKEIAERKRAEKQRKEAELSLKKSEKRFKDITTSMSDWIWELDSNLTYTYSSSNVGPILGYNKNEIIGKTPYDFMDPKEAVRFKLIIDDIIKHRKLFRGLKNCAVTKDNQKVHLLTSGIPIFDNDKYLGYRGVCVDITEKTILRQHLKYALKMESIGALSGNIAHGFNNMLNIIIGYSDIIESKLKLNDPILKDMMEIRKATKEAVNITRQLLAFSRQQKIAFQVTDINETMNNMKNLLIRIIGKDIILKFNLGIDIWKVWTDLSMLDQIIANLAINARDAMNDKGILLIETKNVIVDKKYYVKHVKFIPEHLIYGNFVLVTITDDGSGMNEKIISHMFDPFFTTKDISNNTGLGLSTVYGNIKQNKGFIDVCSKPGKGTIFKLYFPKYDGKIEKYKLPLIKEFKPVNIVLVEDNEMMLNLTELMITSIGHKVNIFKNSKEAIKFCNDKTNKIDILITDVIIPDINGVRLKKEIEAIIPDIKTIFVSGYAKNILADRGIFKEDINFLTKPFTIHDMKKEIEKVLNK